MSTKKAFGVLALLTLIGLIYSYKHLNSYPSSIHTWAQADRYALAIGFVDNNLNFFKPQTLIYNHQFPDEWKTAGADRITAVDFPIHDYIPAVIMKITGSRSPLIFRLYIFLFSLAGLYFLFQLAFLISSNYYKSFFVCLFAATSPVFVFYQANFLPSIPCLACSLIALFFYFKYVKENQTRFLAISILFLTIAALSRTTWIISFLALAGVEFLRLIKHQIKFRLIHTFWIFAMLVFIAYKLYNNFLSEKYGSDFLNYLLPPKNLDHAFELIIVTIKHWGQQYFTVYHWLILGILTIAGFVFFIFSKVNALLRWVLVYWVAVMAGVILFATAMLQQFPDHDYYFLDTFFLPVLIFLSLFLAFIPEPAGRAWKYVSCLSGILVIGLMLYQPIKSQKERYDQVVWNKTQATVENFRDASAFLDSTGVSRNSRILVIDAVAPNLPFVLMQRTGYAVMFPTIENINRALEWKFDYIVLQDEYLINELSYTFPEILSRLHRVGGNGKISQYSLTAHQNENILGSLKNCAGNVFASSHFDFEGNQSVEWINCKRSDSIVFSDNYSGHLSPADEFVLTYRTAKLPMLNTKNITVLISFKILRPKFDGCILVVKLNSENKLKYYREFDLQELPVNEMKWQTANLMVKLPEIDISDYELSVYLWNPRKCEMFYDNFCIELVAK